MELSRRRFGLPAATVLAGGVCPASGTAGHSLVGSGNYRIDVD